MSEYIDLYIWSRLRTCSSGREKGYDDDGYIGNSSKIG
jgi:hypothetical protein